MAAAYEDFGWDWDQYLDCWPAKWLFRVSGHNKLMERRAPNG